ncbi:MAG: hypothetical protein CVU46_04285 [Chloroflexi bacterium HGW-Chloroflexi-8]|nr:MAG: hypothetical protein CVU46_04285 [Chloroflexi bacterium HGW-Chloroflexi-8]
MFSGWGDLSTSIIFTKLEPLAGYCLQGDFPSGEFWLEYIPRFSAHFEILITLEISDQRADRHAGILRYQFTDSEKMQFICQMS